MTKFDKKIMGMRIRKGREDKGFTQDDLADRLGMNRATISSYEGGRAVPPSNILSDLADILELSADHLLGRDSYVIEIELGLGYAIREERLEQGMTQQELADAVGVAQNDISLYERNIIDAPSEIAEKIATVFGMSLPKLLVKYDLYDEEIPDHFEGDVDKYLAFKNAEELDALSENSDFQTLAAHHEGDWTEEELSDIKRFMEFMRSKRSK